MQVRHRDVIKFRFGSSKKARQRKRCLAIQISPVDLEIRSEIVLEISWIVKYRWFFTIHEISNTISLRIFQRSHKLRIGSSIAK
jgi:hypothetical protein